MHNETPKEKGSLVKLSELANDINNAFKESGALAVEAIKGSRASVKAAVRTGGLLSRARQIVGHGNWEKWLEDNCPDISADTALRWIKLANSAQLRDLSDAKNLTDAYRRVGLLPAKEKKREGIGTASVNIFDELFRKYDKGLGPIIDISESIDPSDVPADHRHKLIQRTQPMVEFVDKLKALEVGA